MIKKIILGIFVVGFCFISYSFANSFVQIGSSTYLENTYDSTYQNLVMKGGRFVTTNLGTTKDLFGFGNKNFVFWNNSGLYLYDYYGATSQGIYNCPARLVQGYFNQYRVCPLIGSGEFSINSCSSPLDYNSDIVGNFLQSLVKGDWFYYNHWFGNEGYCRGFGYSSAFCFSSSSIGSTMCFTVSHEPEGSAGGHNPFIGLSGSLGLSSDVSFSNIDYGLLNYPPKYSFDGLEGSNESNVNNVVTGDYVYSDCTWNDILIALEAEGYNKYVCYGGIDNFQLYDPELSYNPIAGTGLSISQIWANSSARAWDTFPDWFTFWQGLYLDSSDNNYNAMWSSYPAVYHTYFQIYNSYGGGLDPRTLLEYCQLRTLTGDSLNNSAGGYFKPVCETVIREKQTGLRDCRVNGTLYSGCDQNPQVAIGTNWNGVGNMSGVSVKSDGINFIQDYYNLIKSKLQTNGFTNNFVGIIPGYIIVFLLGIILFRFISH